MGKRIQTSSPVVRLEYECPTRCGWCPDDTCCRAAGWLAVLASDVASSLIGSARGAAATKDMPHAGCVQDAVHPLGGAVFAVILSTSCGNCIALLGPLDGSHSKSSVLPGPLGAAIVRAVNEIQSCMRLLRVV